MMTDVVIVGGGVIGMLTARELHKAGADVLVIERGPLGGESSWAGGGIISPLYPWRYSDAVNQLAAISKTLYPSLAQQLQAESGVDCELLSSGLLFTETDEQQQAQSWAQQWSVKLDVINDSEQIHQIEPQASNTIDSGLWLPDIMQIRNPKIIKALKGSFESRGIPFMENTPVTSLEIRGDKAIGVNTADKKYVADKVIIASGAWSAGFFSENQHVEIEPVKGQMIMFKGEPGLIKRMVLSSGHYIIPRQDGHVLAGSTLEHTGFNKNVTDDALTELRRDAIAIIPVLEQMQIERHWAGLRPGTEQGIPYICQHTEIEGLYLHAGHYRNGIVLGPASVQLMVELVLGNEPGIDPAPYALEAVH